MKFLHTEHRLAAIQVAKQSEIPVNFTNINEITVRKCKFVQKNKYYGKGYTSTKKTHTPKLR